MGAPGETQPSAGLLGWTAGNGVWGLPHGGRSLTGGGTLLDWSWERPVSLGLWRLWESGWREGCSRSSGCCALRYMSPVVVGSLNEQLHNPELDTLSPDVPTRRRRLHLRAATARMKAAALGQDLDMHDSGEAQEPTLQDPLTQALVHCFSSPAHYPQSLTALSRLWSPAHCLSSFTLLLELPIAP